MKEIQLQLDVGTLKIYREHYRQLFKKKFDWRETPSTSSSSWAPSGTSLSAIPIAHDE
jgi:hypothetical protein